MVWMSTTATDLIASLAASVGEDAARSAVSAERTRLGLGETMPIEDAARLLQAIEARGGAAGLAARLVRVRLDRTSSAGTGISRMAAVVLPTYLVSQIVDMFASALGQEKSHEIVRQHLQQHGITSDVLTFEQVSHMLDVLSRHSGVVSTVARFAKAKLLLKAGG